MLAGIKKFEKDQSLLGASSSRIQSDGRSALTSDLASATNNSAGSGTNEVDYEHRTILFRLILKKDWRAVVQRAAEYPHEAATWIVTKGFNGNLRFLPLHKACVLAPPEGVIDALLDAYPEGARCTDQDSWVPLHCACFYGSSEEVVRALLRAYPKGAQCLDDEGRCALSYSCLKAASAPVVIALLSAFPKGAMVKDNEERLPLAHACSKGASEKVIITLLKVAPKAAQARDAQGRLALHHATRAHLGGDGFLSRFLRYNQSKLANAVFTIALASKQSKVKALCGDPGISASNLVNVMGASGKIIKDVSALQIQVIRGSALHYVENWKRHRETLKRID